MREILFRGKAAYTNEWIYGSYFKDKNGMSWIDYKEDYFYLVVPDTVGQYTGLKDRSGYKIFEGDVLQDLDDGALLEAEWNENEASFCASEINDYCCYVANEMVCFEVIGNKWDNPELLKEE